jgi:hypothetical protein
MSAATLTVRSGSLEGQTFALELGEGETVVGSAAECDVYIDVPGIAPRHAAFQVSGDEVLVQAAGGGAEIEVNGQPIPWLTPVNDGDLIALGSLQLEYRVGGAGEAEEVEGTGSPFSWPAETAPAAGAAPEGGMFVAAPTPEAPASQPEPVAEAPTFDFGGESTAEAPFDLNLAPAAPEPVPPPEAVPERTPEPVPAPAPLRAAPLKLKEPEPAAAPPAEAVSETAPDAAGPAVRPRSPRPARRPVQTAGRRGRIERKPIGRYAMVSLVIIAVLGAGAYLVAPFLMAPVLEAVAPPRVSAGQVAVLSGQYFRSDPEDNAVLFDELPGRVIQASRTRLHVEIPAMPLGAAAGRSVSVRVRVGTKESGRQSVSIFQPPQITSVVPDVAMPGEVVSLGGSGWDDKAAVRFGATEGEVVDIAPGTIHVRVPTIKETASQVTVMVGDISSSSAPFLVGRLPLLTAAEPSSVSPGDRLIVRGKGFGDDPGAVLATIAGAPALVLAAQPGELTLVVPRVSPQEGQPPLEIRLAGKPNVGHLSLDVAPLPDPIGFRFIAEPFTGGGTASAPLAVVASGLGPNFVLARSGGRSAALRAIEVQDRLNAAASQLARPGQTLETRGSSSSPAIGLKGSSEVLIDVTVEDAAAYNEAWARPRGSGAPVTPERLAIWWKAVADDLASLLARGEEPREAEGLAREGRVLTQLHQAAGTGAVTLRLVDSKPAFKEGLRTLGLHVPAAIPGAAAPVEVSATGEPAAVFSATGTWRGFLREAGRSRPVNVVFEGTTGSLTYEGTVSFSAPLQSVKQKDNEVQFSAAQGGGVRYFTGHWDGTSLSGTISSKSGGPGDIGSFELKPPRH